MSEWWTLGSTWASDGLLVMHEQVMDSIIDKWYKNMTENVLGWSTQCHSFSTANKDRRRGYKYFWKDLEGSKYMGKTQ